MVPDNYYSTYHCTIYLNYLKEQYVVLHQYLYISEKKISKMHLTK